MTAKKQLLGILGLVAVIAAPAAFGQSSSTSYEIKFDVVSGGGGTASSTSYTLTDAIAQPSALGSSASASYRLEPGILSPPDFDEDGVRNFLDNCIQEPNADQRDTNGDRFGNICDADLNNDNNTNAADLGLLRLNFLTSDPDADFNGDGVVNFADLGILRLRFFSPPGPSGTAP